MDDLKAIFVEGERDESYVYGVYFVSQAETQKVDAVFRSLHFERITLRAYGGMILPILLSEFLWSLGQNVESAVYGHLGTANLAAYTLTCPIQSLIVGALSGLSAASIWERKPTTPPTVMPDALC
jgi:Na+-driven multidrug efflux pump